MATQLFVPAMVLVLWSLIMLIWTAATRFPAIARTGVDVKNVPPGGRGQNLDGVLPDKVQWKSHNYAHLMEQPTIFYATALALAVMGEGGSLAVNLAWGYAGLRIVHSLVQILSNRVVVRFLVFALASLCLLGLVLLALSIASAQA